MTAATLIAVFPHRWQAEILPARPLVLPARHFVYPAQADEVERGALEVLISPGEQPLENRHSTVRPDAPGLAPKTWESTSAGHNQSGNASLSAEPSGAPGLGSPQTGPRRWGGGLDFQTWESTPAEHNRRTQPFLATCALGFRDAAAPTGLWSTPRPDELCAVSGGYAYLIDTTAPERFTMIPYRPVLEILPAPAQNLLLFVGHRAILAWGAEGLAWESEPLSSEGITLAAMEGDTLRGLGWEMIADKEIPFALDLRTGLRISLAEDAPTSQP